MTSRVLVLRGPRVPGLPPVFPAPGSTPVLRNPVCFALFARFLLNLPKTRLSF